MNTKNTLPPTSEEQDKSQKEDTTAVDAKRGLPEMDMEDTSKKIV